MSSLGSFLNVELLGGPLGRAASRAWSWYCREIRAIIAPETLTWLLDRGDRRLVLRAGEKDLRFVDGAGAIPAPISADELMASSLAEALARRGIARDAIQTALEIDSSAFLVRRFDIPTIAMVNLPKLLVADIERKTPFHASDVVYGHHCRVHSEAPDKASVELWILRRDIISKALEGAGVTLEDIAVISPQAFGNNTTKPPIINLDNRTKEVDWFYRLVIGLSGLTVLFALVAVGATLWRQDLMGVELNAKIVETSARASHVRQAADHASAESRLLTTLRLEKENTPQFADLWEEASRLLPDGAYVTELRLTEAKAGERSIELVGFADSVVGLPALFDKSQIFSDAALTAAITPDAREKREGFSLRAKVGRKAAAPSK